MKLNFYYSPLCPDCPPAMEALQVRNISYEGFNITEDLGALKSFLALRDIKETFSPIKENGKIGIPCFVLKDSILFSLEEVLQMMEDE